MRRDNLFLAAPRTITLTSHTLVWLALAVVFLAAAGSTAAAAVLPEAVDWQGVFYPASHALLEGRSPYVAGYYNAPWAALVMAPFATDVQVGRGALFIVSLTVYALVAVALGAKPVALALWLTCPPILHTLLHGNLEWLVLAGLLMPPRWGLFVVLIKPQVAGALVLWWAVEAWREGGWRAVMALLWPVTLALSVSVALFGLWPLRALDTTQLWWNASLWPWSIAPGLGLLGWSLYARDWRAALAASPMLSPYVLLHAWAGAVLATIHNTRLFAIVIAALWALVLWRVI